MVGGRRLVENRAILVKFVKLIPLGDSRVTLELSGDTESHMEMYVPLLGKEGGGHRNFLPVHCLAKLK